jgi:hypothetical protein
VIGLVSFVKTWVLVHFLLILCLQLFAHLFEVLDGGGCNEKSFVVQMMINFVALLDSWNWVDFHLDMGLVVDENLADMLKKVVDWACAFLWPVITVFVVFGSFAVVMVFEDPAHFEGNVRFDDFFNVLICCKWRYFVLASDHLGSFRLQMVGRVALVHDVAVFFQS